MSNFIRIKHGVLLLTSLLSFGSYAATEGGLACVMPPSQQGGVAPNDGPIGMDALGLQVAKRLTRPGVADLLEKEVQVWIDARCKQDDGRLWISAVPAGFKEGFTWISNWDTLRSLVGAYRNKRPESPIAAAAEAEYWVAYAWNARGSGYSGSVTADGRRLFNERLAKAEQVLIESRPYSTSLPFWYEQMISVQGALGRPEEERNKIFAEGISKFSDYYPTYFAMLNFTLPKWGGSWEAVDDLVSQSVRQTESSDGNTMYARMYWSVAQGLSGDTELFGGTRASWPKMKKGFEDLMARHPKSKWNLNNFAKFSCMAKDKKTFLMLRKRIGGDVMQEAWPQNLSLDLCEHKFGYKK